MTTANARPRSAPGRPRRRSTLGGIAVIVFVFMAGLGVLVGVAAIAVYNILADDLAPPSELTEYELPEESIVYDRTGETELGRFGDWRREVVTFEELPPILLDATTAIEDKTFWENAGFDPVAIVSAGLDSIRGDSRGASTITQQLVRARLLEEELVQDPDRTIERKLKEIIQSIRVTLYFPGEEGKQEIITAYMNQNYSGNQSYGVKAAIEGYFGIPMAEITPAQAAIIAGLPQSPSNYDLVRNAVEDCSPLPPEGEECPAANSTLIVPEDTKIVQRRNTILDLLAEGDRT
ncbi:MAG TPA: biosynthetic peptidoglycan transglycosylase, partial [Candidatus Limnocylindrales bacterium]